MLQQVGLSDILFELASDNMTAYICPLPIHKHIEINFLTCTCKVGGLTLSQNIVLACKLESVPGNHNMQFQLKIVPKLQKIKIRCKKLPEHI